MTIRAFLERWTRESLELFPSGTLFPIAVSPHATPTELNEDGTITLTATFAYSDEKQKEEFISAFKGHLEEVKKETKSILTVTIDKD